MTKPHLTSLNFHGVKVLQAQANKEGSTEWLTICGREFLDDWLGPEFTVTLFMPFESATAYANAINACNDREALAEAAARKEAFDTLPDDYEAPH